MKTLRFLLMGDKGVGKTSLLEAYLWKLNFGCIYHDHVSEECRYLIDVIEINTLEELHEQLAEKSCQIVNVFMVCFNVTDRKTLIIARSDWILELLKIDPKTKIFLVGLQCDLRDQLLTKLRTNCVSKSDGINVCLYYQNVQYLECSGMKLPSVKDVFDEALNLTLYSLDDTADEKVIELFDQMQISFKFKEGECDCKYICE